LDLPPIIYEESFETAFGSAVHWVKLCANLGRALLLLMLTSDESPISLFCLNNNLVRLLNIKFAPMKKLLCALVLIVCSTAKGQTDTVSDFLMYNLFNGAIYRTMSNGYATGNNELGDLEKGMRFNSLTGITSNNGYVTNVLAWIPYMSNNSGTGQITAKIYEFASVDSLGPLLGSQPLLLNNLDTNTVNYQYIDGALAQGGRPYNVNIIFSNPVAIPPSHDFLVMIQLPTTTGDSIAIISNINGDFAYAATHTFEVKADNSLINFHDSWQEEMDVALAIYPVITYTNSLATNEISCTVYPNPTTNKLYFQTDSEIASIIIKSVDGKTVASDSSNSISVNQLQTGIYLYSVLTVSGQIATGSFSKIN
jgi:hypothetical protein